VLKKGDHNSDIALKDLNFCKTIKLGEELKKVFIEQLEKDCKWMEERNVCDYSLLVGIHTITDDSQSNKSQKVFGKSASMMSRWHNRSACIWTREYGGISAKNQARKFISWELLTF